MAEQDFKKFSGAGSALAKLGKIAGKGLAGAGKAVGRKSMPKISITIDEEFRLPEEGELHPRFPMEDEEDDFPFPDMAQRSPFGKWPRSLQKTKKDLAKIRAQRLEDEKQKKEKD